MAKKNNSGFGIGCLVIGTLVGTLALLIKILPEIWVVLALMVALGIIVYFFQQSKTNAEDSKAKSDSFRDQKTPPKNNKRPSSEIRQDNEKYPDNQYKRASPDYHLKNIGENEKDYRIPSAPKGFGNGTWLPLGQSFEAAGLKIKHGMIYLGRTLKTPYGGNDPCLIDPSQNVASIGDYRERQMGYWPSYSEISPLARRAYLNWLDDGRKDPEADIGYVFLFFYGLERRAILDFDKDVSVKAELPEITAELLRLLSIYGEKSNSFRRYAGELLNWISLLENPKQLYEKSIPALPKTFELPIYIRLALGQAAVDSVPVPVNLALAWVRLDPGMYLRTPTSRCSEQFDLLFCMKYIEAFGSGLVLPRNRTKLKFVYRPASSGFRGYEELRLSFGEIPDVSVLTAPLKKIQQIVEATTVELEPYSRFVGKNPDEKFVLEGLLQLPLTLWPESAKNSILNIQARMVSGLVAMSFQELLAAFKAKSILTKEKTLALARALEAMNIGMEPDILGGVKIPKPDEKVVLFVVPHGEITSRTTPTYQVAVLTLQLASAVAAADGEFSTKEMEHLRGQVLSWSHLTPNHIRRLLAHISLLMITPVTLASLRKKLEPLDSSARETIGTFMATVAQSDGIVSPDEIKILEKVYKALGLEPKKVFSDIHALVAGVNISPTRTTEIEKTGFKLDAARIAVLQQDTEKVSSLLANIFKEEEAVSVTIPEEAIETESHESYQGILGLDEAHSTLARMLLSRPEWTREELLDVASDLDLMLDGALERINEASFDVYDAPLVEGENPVAINADILEKIES